MSDYFVLTVNPGSTSTKVAIFKGLECLFKETVEHDADELATYPTISAQLPYRQAILTRVLEDAGFSEKKFDAIVGRGGGLMPLEGGTYQIDDRLLYDAKVAANGVEHPANLGPQIAHALAQLHQCPAFVVNAPDTDELDLKARITGVKGVYRSVHLHALNLKETALRHAQNINSKYEDQNYIVCHIGGGISVSAHRQGQMIDGTDIVGGEGALAPTRCGSLPVTAILDLLESGWTSKECRQLCTKNGGLVSHFGTADAKQVFEQGQAGDNYAQLIWDSMLYQIAKSIGAMATALKGQVDGILLGGGLVHNENLVEQVKEACSWIAPVFAYPGEFEMEAMASGANRVLSGQEIVKTYTGQPVWSKEAFEASL